MTDVGFEIAPVRRSVAALVKRNPRPKRGYSRSVRPFDQAGFSVRFDWGEAGLRTLAPGVDLLIIVDVLSFSTAVEVATARGAAVYPYPVADTSAQAFANEQRAVLAVNRRNMSGERPYSLSPRSLAEITPGTRVVLPSPNGSTLTTLASKTHLILAGCLRNARAVARWASVRNAIGVIAAGELRPDGRPALCRRGPGWCRRDPQPLPRRDAFTGS